MCDKASISLNGISLTIAEIYVDGCEFSIAVIPHTWSNTCLQYLTIGEKVNLEVDLMAKYAEKLLKVNNNVIERPQHMIMRVCVAIHSDSIKDAIKGDITAVPIPPAPQSKPIARPNLLRNQRLTAAMSGTIDIDCVIDNMTPNVRKKCQASVMIPINTMLDAYRSPPDIIINRGP